MDSIQEQALNTVIVQVVWVLTLAKPFILIYLAIMLSGDVVLRTIMSQME
jgi:hypothetical protein